MWKNVLKGSAIMAALLGILAAVGIAAVDRQLHDSFGDGLDDDDVM